MSDDSARPDGPARAASGSRPRIRTEAERVEREREMSRRWRERNADTIRENKRVWREQNADHIRTYRRAYREEHLDEIRAKGRERERARSARARAERERGELKRVAAREWYAQNRDRHLDAQRRHRAAQRAKDPEAYRAAKRERERRWRARHRDEQNAKRREKHRENPEARRVLGQRYYANNAEKLKAKRRERYAANREKERARQQLWREREKRRVAAGLPPRRVHRVSAEERRANRAAADEFFARSYTREQIVAIRKPLTTKARLIARFNRDSLRARANAHQQGDAGMHDRFQRSESRQTELEQDRARRRTAKEIEDARLDAIAQEINDRLRTQPRRHRRPNDPDPSAPHAVPGPTPGGMGL